MRQLSSLLPFTRNHRLTAFTALHLTTALFLFGCGEDTLTGTDLGGDVGGGVVDLVEDPLTGVLNSTQGFTPPDPDQRITRLADALGLDETQIAALTEAYTTFRTGIEDLRAQVVAGDLTRDEAKAQAAVLREAFETELQLILTTEQWDLFQEMRQNREGPRRGHRDRGDRWASWLTEIGADEAQTAAIMDALATLHDGVHAIHDQVKAGEITRDEAMTAAQALKEAFDAALQDNLTEEQYNALQELRPDCRGMHRR